MCSKIFGGSKSKTKQKVHLENCSSFLAFSSCFNSLPATNFPGFWFILPTFLLQKWAYILILLSFIQNYNILSMIFTLKYPGNHFTSIYRAISHFYSCVLCLWMDMQWLILPIYHSYMHNRLLPIFCPYK